MRGRSGFEIDPVTIFSGRGGGRSTRLGSVMAGRDGAATDLKTGTRSGGRGTPFSWDTTQMPAAKPPASSHLSFGSANPAMQPWWGQDFNIRQTIEAATLRPAHPDCHLSPDLR
jgi:hypothetical protein